MQVGNHDNSRITTRMGVEFADAINIFLALMPGIMVTYNGEELAMEDTFVRWDQTVDPSGRNMGKDNYLAGTRDPERTPMQWDTSINAGKIIKDFQIIMPLRYEKKNNEVSFIPLTGFSDNVGYIY